MTLQCEMLKLKICCNKTEVKAKKFPRARCPHSESKQVIHVRRTNHRSSQVGCDMNNYFDPFLFSRWQMLNVTGIPAASGLIWQTSLPLFRKGIPPCRETMVLQQYRWFPVFFFFLVFLLSRLSTRLRRLNNLATALLKIISCNTSGSISAFTYVSTNKRSLFELQ